MHNCSPALQLFCSQMMHEKVRMDCIEYGRKNPSEFQNLIPSNEAWEEHLNKLAVHMVICGNIEIQLISKTYRYVEDLSFYFVGNS